MTEHTTQSAENQAVTDEMGQVDGVPLLAGEEEEQKQQSQRPVIWTPRFIVVFFVAGVIGLSVASLLTQLWLDGYFNIQKILIGHVVVLLIGLVVLIVKSRATWLRVSGIFGCIWAIFTGASYIAILLGIGSRSIIELDFQATMACALLGTYICFSTHNIEFHRWDGLFFWLAPIIGGIAVAILYAHSHANPHHARVLINATITVLLWLSVAIWWLRPSCWRSQPCMTFFFGLTAILMIAVPSIPKDDMGTPLFVSQVVMLCLLLGIIRVVQGEIREA